MAKKVILKDLHDVEILPITRGELVLDSSGGEAFHSNLFLATDSLPGLMSKEDKIKLDKVDENGPTISLVNATTDGLAPKIGTAAASTVTTQADEWVLTSTKGATPTWRKLPTNAFLNYYRPILVNGTSLLGNNNTALNIAAGTNINLTTDAGKVTINNSLTKVSQLTNDSGYLTNDSLNNYVTLNTALTITGVKTFQSRANDSTVTIDSGHIRIDAQTYGGWSRALQFGNTDTDSNNQTTTVKANVGVYGAGCGTEGTRANKIFYIYLAHLDLTYLDATLKVYNDRATITDNEIYHKGNLTKLSDLTDDILSGKYLPLTGGTISGINNTPLFINCTTENAWSGIRFLNLNVSLGAIGAQSDTPFYITSDNKQRYKIWHAGNDGHESGLDADMLDGQEESAFLRDRGIIKANTIETTLTNGVYYTSEFSPPDTGYNYGSVLNFRSYPTLTLFYMSDGAQKNNPSIWYRNKWNAQNGIDSSWIEILTSKTYTSYLPFLNSTTAHASNTSVIYAPTTAGTKDYVLVSNGSGAPVWKEYVNKSLSLLCTNFGDVDANTLFNTNRAIKWYAALSSASSNLPLTSSWKNGILELGLHGDGYTAQLYFTEERKRFYYRSNYDKTWEEIACLSDIPTSLKNPNTIKFKNISGTVVSYDGSSAVDLTGGVFEAMQLARTTFTDGLDLNTIKKEHVYVNTNTNTCFSLVNGPTNRSNGEIRLESVTCGSNSYGFQTLYTRNTARYEIWYRTWSGDSFTSWVKNIHSGNYSSYLGYIGTTAVLANSNALALTGITDATMSGVTTTGTLVISKKTSDYHIMFSRGSSTEYPYNYIGTPAGGIICILPNGAANSSSGGMQFASDGLRPATTGAYSLGNSSKKWNYVYANTFVGNLDGTYINKLTGYSKATSASDLVATDTLNLALGKLEYKAGVAYSWYRTITEDDTDEIINKWDEVVDFVNNLEVDLTDEFVTRKTDLTITGSKTFTASINTFSGTGTAILTVDRNSSSPAWIRFCKNGSLLGFLGVTNNKVAQFYTNDTAYNLLHDGNYSKYLPFLNSTSTHASNTSVIYAPISAGTANLVLISSGSGAPIWANLNSISAGSATNSIYLEPIKLDVINANNLEVSNQKVSFISHISDESLNLPTFSSWANGILNIGLHSTAKLSALLYFSSNKPLYYRPNTNSDWKQIAYTDSNITGNAATATHASTATKLQTPVKLWGNDFDGSSDVNDNIYIGKIHSANVKNRATLSVVSNTDIPSDIMLGSNSAVTWVLTARHSEESNKLELVNQSNYARTVTFTLNDCVGIGTVNPSYRLHVAGNTFSDGFKKKDSSDDYVLLGGGGHKALSEFLLESELATQELSANLTTITKELTVTQDWMDTGIAYNNLPDNGSYIVLVYVQANDGTGRMYNCYWSGVMTWYVTHRSAIKTNDTESDEIILHRSGHAYLNTIYLRTIMTTGGDSSLGVKLLIAANKNLGAAYTYTFKFKRII